MLTRMCAKEPAYSRERLREIGSKEVINAINCHLKFFAMTSRSAKINLERAGGDG